MKEIAVSVVEGPLGGKRVALRLGRIVIGREPGSDGFALPGDFGVSREHGELRVDDQQVLYRNLSANGSIVDGQEVQGEVEIQPGASLRIGQHLLTVNFRPALAGQARAEAREDVLHRGALAKPAVRVLIGVYLLLLAGVAAYLASAHETPMALAFRTASRDYRLHYRIPGLRRAEADAALAGRAVEADRLVGELDGTIRAERWSEARRVCTQIMDLDRDPASPIFRFAAQESASLPAR